MHKAVLAPDLYCYCLKYGVREHPALQELRLESSKLSNSQMLISPDQGAFMAQLARLISAKSYLEVGVFTGYSTLWMALAMPSNAKITALDISDEHLSLANAYWQRAGVAEKITAIIAPAADSLLSLQQANEVYDFAFIDANKSEYIDYYEACLRLVRPGGLIVIDNVLMYGQVLEESPRKNYVNTLKKLNDLIYHDERVDICMLAIGDGMTLARKKDIYEA
ncbi:MAG: methyltransferase domain-containing protein [Neisseriaceae bacterium]|nr:MAG: methyltransferase domain-containing protein [Neisseriaceae bacterium]